MLNYLWSGMILIGILFAAFSGKMSDITIAALDSSKEAVTLCITMMGVMSFWTGLMEIAEKSGILKTAADCLSPLIHFLFPELPKDHPAENAPSYDRSNTSCSLPVKNVHNHWIQSSHSSLSFCKEAFLLYRHPQYCNKSGYSFLHPC